MGAYVTFDSLDAGQIWNEKPPGLGRIGCIPSNSDGGLAQFDAVFTVAAPVIGAAITAGGAIGAAAISANASKYAIKTQTKAELQVALARANSELEQAKAMAGAQVDMSREITKQKNVEAQAATEQTKLVTQQVGTSVVPLIAVLGLAGIAAVIAFGE